MTMNTPDRALELRSLVTSQGTVELSLEDLAVQQPGNEQVLVRIEASPINPSDLGLLLAGADVDAAEVTGTNDRPVVSLPLPEGALRRLAPRVDKSLPVGNEGAGTVVATGSSPAAAALLGKTISAAGGSMYSQYRVLDASGCLVLPEGTTARDGASSFVNPLTALGMVATMRREGHCGIVHTAAASNLGQMLVRLCLEENVPLVNIVRKSEHTELLRSIGAEHVVQLDLALIHDRPDRGTHGNHGHARLRRHRRRQAREPDPCRHGGGCKFVGHDVLQIRVDHSQAGLHLRRTRPSPTVLSRSFGFAWGLGGWLLTPFLQSISPDEFSELRARVAAGLTSTFASRYTCEVSLAGALRLEALATYAKQATGEKYLIAPHLA